MVEHNIMYVYSSYVTHFKTEININQWKEKKYCFHSRTSFPAYRIKDFHAVCLLKDTQTGPVLWETLLASDTAHFFRPYSHQVSACYLLTSFNKALLLGKSLMRATWQHWPRATWQHWPHPSLYLPLQLVHIV
jgi:hypothetical protein